MLLVEPRLEVGPGFLQFMGVSVLGTLVLALWAAGGLPDAAWGDGYVVERRLSVRPLVGLTARLLAARVAHAASGLWRGGMAALQRFGPVVWIRAGFGILFPLVMAGFVWYSCRIRAMRTATGLL